MQRGVASGASTAIPRGWPSESSIPACSAMELRASPSFRPKIPPASAGFRLHATVNRQAHLPPTFRPPAAAASTGFRLREAFARENVDTERRKEACSEGLRRARPLPYPAALGTLRTPMPERNAPGVQRCNIPFPPRRPPASSLASLETPAAPLRARPGRSRCRVNSTPRLKDRIYTMDPPWNWSATPTILCEAWIGNGPHACIPDQKGVLPPMPAQARPNRVQCRSCCRSCCRCWRCNPP